jgi:hypothetical protein
MGIVSYQPMIVEQKAACKGWQIGQRNHEPNNGVWPKTKALYSLDERFHVFSDC